jgi:nucleoid-associated protein YgaU
MTRETKIGLLVGLAFIIVIGILLSDHLTSATEPQQAQLAQVAGNVRNGVAVPGGANAQPPITQVAPPADVTPQQPVMTKEELTPKQPPVEIVKIGGPANPAPAPQQQQQPVPAANDAKAQATTNTEPPITVVDSGTTSAPQVKPLDPSKNPLARVAEAFKEEIVPVGADAQPKSEPTKPTIAVAALPPGARHYKAAGGDTLSRLASRFLGGDTKANRDAILAVNPTLQKNPDIIVLGRTYVIPAAPTASVAPAQLPTTPAAPAPITPPPVPAPIEIAQQTPPPVPAPVTPTPATPDAAPAQPESFYVVKPGDSLTKIAVEQLGSPAGVPALMDLNRDTLKGTDRIRPNMKLRLPAKPMAAAM